MDKQYPQYKFGSPSKESYQIAPPELSVGTRIAAGTNGRPEESIRVDVTLTNAPEWFNQLRAEPKAIEAEFGITDGRWEWEERTGKAESHILRKQLRLDGSRTPQYQWLAKGVHKFHKVFGPRICALK